MRSSILNALLHIITAIKLRKFREQMKNAYDMVLGKYDLGVEGRILLNGMLKEQGLYWIHLVWDKIQWWGSCDNGNETSVCIKSEGFLDQLSDYQLFTNEIAGFQFKMRNIFSLNDQLEHFTFRKYLFPRQSYLTLNKPLFLCDERAVTERMDLQLKILNHSIIHKLYSI
jgi:hypothetical protein